MFPVLVVTFDGHIKVEAIAVSGDCVLFRVGTYSSSWMAQGRPSAALTVRSIETRTQNARFHSSSSTVIGPL